MIIKRFMAKQLKKAAKELPVIAILGPRQSGKTTLVRQVFDKHFYCSLEMTNVFEAIKNDPQGFIDEHANEHGIIFDEFQHFPELLSYIQVVVDEWLTSPKAKKKDRRPGYFILTGSQNFLMNEAITQSLAGRISLFTLLPLSLAELKQAKLAPKTISEALFKGFYPRLYTTPIDPVALYNGYINTYVERDVRSLQNVVSLSDFKKFMRLCAGRVGQLLNIASLASDCGIDQKTAHAWLSVLEASYIVYLVQPYFRNNFGKRLMKSPKLYFYDTGLACSLLGIESDAQLFTHYLRGELFESMMIMELVKHFYNERRSPPLYFWRDHHGNEIDCIIEQENKLTPVEIKVSQTISKSFYKGFYYWNETAGKQATNGFLIYGGSRTFRYHEDRAIGWKSIEKIFEK